MQLYGYKGRTAIHEILPIDKDIYNLILEGASSDIINKHAVQNGFITLKGGVSGI